MKTNKCRGGFTLVELLCVIAIVCLLVSLALPGLARARLATRATVCQNNQRQIAVGIRAYLGDNEWLPPGDISDAYSIAAAIDMVEGCKWNCTEGDPPCTFAYLPRQEAWMGHPAPIPPWFNPMRTATHQYEDHPWLLVLRDFDLAGPHAGYYVGVRIDGSGATVLGVPIDQQTGNDP